MLTTLIASISFGVTLGQGATLHCPVMGSAVNKPAEAIAYNGVLYGTCCGGCGSQFTKDPGKFLKSDKIKGKAVGVFMFDPVAGAKVDTTKSKFGPVTHNGTQFYFLEEKNMATFKADPKKYAAMPEKEALFCPVMGHEIKGGYAGAGGYADVEGVRYYVCCGGCLGQMKADGKKFVAKAAKAVKAPTAVMLEDASVFFAQEGKAKKEECKNCEAGECSCGGH